MSSVKQEVVVMCPNSKAPIRTYSYLKLIKNIAMMEELCEVLQVSKDVIEVLKENKPYKLEPLKKGDKRYHSLNNIFRGTTKPSTTYTMEYIHLVKNPYLNAQYNLKMRRKEELYGFCYDTMLFHGTKMTDVASICKHNFNWRLVKKHLFGKGISFAQYARYASYYPKNAEGDRRAMIMSMVSYVRKCEGEEDMVLPPFTGYDTAVKPNEAVWVKFEDAEFLPACLFHYKNYAEYHDESSEKMRKFTNNFERMAVDIESIFNCTLIDENDPNIVVVKAKPGPSKDESQIED